MKTNNILKACIVLLLSIGLFYIVKIERNLSELNSKVSKFNFYSKKDLKAIKDIGDKKLKDSLLNAQTIIQVRGSVDAYVENPVDVNVNN